ncbi:MAG: alpha-amylase family glycosyl hydrolase, partial [Ruminococcus sp.]|nr:alpha-amylase family glycosyl hydrolase [Ruminococcus sp.]
MKRKSFHRCISLLLSLCMVLSCVTFASSTVGAATISESEDSAVSAAEPNENFSWDNASVYFLLTDRFKNGNKSNDNSYGRGKDKNGNVVSGIDTRGTFHGGDFAGVTQAIEEGYFTNLGVNALWISAPYEQLHGYVVGDDSSSSFAHYSYHGYYVLDYTQTDANFGTAQEFETLVDTAHKNGLRVIIDVVMNHSGYNSIYDMNEYGFGTVKSGWENSYFSHQTINNKTYHSFIDYDSNASDWAKWWGADWIRCGIVGYTAGGGDNYTMSLAGLPDFKTESTATVG